jgi:hypothetical protein
MTKHQRNRQEWQKLVDEYDNRNGISKTKYCQEKGVNSSSFCKWHQLLSPNRGEFIKVKPVELYKPQKYWLKLFGIKLLRLELDV